MVDCCTNIETDYHIVLVVVLVAFGYFKLLSIVGLQYNSELNTKASSTNRIEDHAWEGGGETTEEVRQEKRK